MAKQKLTKTFTKTTTDTTKKRAGKKVNVVNKKTANKKKDKSKKA